ncbi:MAG: D-inositol-3-phosphate glycosyltransferase [Parabacteroides sp.]
MVCEKISSSILFISTDYKAPKGGIAKLVNHYSFIFNPFLHISSVERGNLIYKVYVFVKSIILLIIYLIQKKIKIVHIHSSSHTLIYREWLYVKIAKCFRCKIVLHLHGGEFELAYKKHTNKIASIVGSVDAVICVSNYIKNICLRNDLNRNVFVVYNIVEKPVFSYRKTFGKINVLFLGTIDNNKGIFDILDCMIANQDYLRKYIILNIGGIGESDKLISIINKGGVSDFVIYHGWIDENCKKNIFNHTDIYIQPSYFESLGIAIIEAMGYGIPIIASNSGGIPELVTHGVNGFLINPGDMDLFFVYLNKFINNRSLILDFGEKSKEKSKLFYPEFIESKLLEIYTMLID